MKVEGKLIVVMDVQQVTDTFKKREFVIEFAENPEYPELLKLEMIQDKCSQLDDFSIGQMVIAEFNLKGRKWTDPQGVDKYFNTIQAWKISQLEPTLSLPSNGESDALPF
jgi:hypothetical protein